MIEMFAYWFIGVCLIGIITTIIVLGVEVSRIYGETIILVLLGCVAFIALTFGAYSIGHDVVNSVCHLNGC